MQGDAESLEERNAPAHVRKLLPLSAQGGHNYVTGTLKNGQVNNETPKIETDARKRQLTAICGHSKQSNCWLGSDENQPIWRSR